MEEGDPCEFSQTPETGEWILKLGVCEDSGMLDAQTREASVGRGQRVQQRVDLKASSTI